ncbi:hypothetical protein LC593_28415 [Nostoc sp. CHAB 5844]|nr:hypothetical protein [Nostoc sp. CHAB 5844]
MPTVTQLPRMVSVAVTRVAFDVGNPTLILVLGFADAQPNLRLMHYFSLDTPVHSSCQLT